MEGENSSTPSGYSMLQILTGVLLQWWMPLGLSTGLDVG